MYQPPILRHIGKDPLAPIAIKMQPRITLLKKADIKELIKASKASETLQEEEVLG